MYHRIQRCSVALMGILCFSPVTLQAQLPGAEGALFEGRADSGLIAGVRWEDWNRKVAAGNRSETLDMSRFVATLQVPVHPGASVWLEGGWHDPEQSNVGGKGGLTWGAGVSSRLYRVARRVDPEIGPREWTAVKFEAGARGGEAPANVPGDLEWFQWEGRLGLEWHQRYLGANRGPIGTTGQTLEAGVLWTDLQADRPGVSASGRQSTGVYLRAHFALGTHQFFGLEADWMSSSDRRYALVGGWRF